MKVIILHTSPVIHLYTKQDIPLLECYEKLSVWLSGNVPSAFIRRSGDAGDASTLTAELWDSGLQYVHVLYFA